MKNIIKVDGKAYSKTLQFGNQAYRTVYKNRKAYDRAAFKRERE